MYKKYGGALPRSEKKLEQIWSEEAALVGEE
jgi:hypothetical protein